MDVTEVRNAAEKVGNLVGPLVQAVAAKLPFAAKSPVPPSTGRNEQGGFEMNVAVDEQGVVWVEWNPKLTLDRFLDAIEGDTACHDELDRLAKKDKVNLASVVAVLRTEAQRAQGAKGKKYQPTPQSKAAFKQAKDDLNRILRAAEKCDPAKLCPNGPPGAPQSASQCGTENKYVPWPVKVAPAGALEGWNGPIKVSTGGEAYLVMLEPIRTNLVEPGWWPTFVAVQRAIDRNVFWQQGHVIGAQFGGKTGADNFTAQYRRFNLSPFKTCENRVNRELSNDKNACIYLKVTVHYGADPIVPEAFSFRAIGLRNSCLDIDIRIAHLPNTSSPVECQP